MRDMNTIELNGRAIDVSSIEIDGIDTRDYPDFCDAYMASAEYKDGTPLTDDELDELMDKYDCLTHELVFEQLF